MAEFPSKVSTRTSSPAQGVGASVSAMRPDLGFVRSALGVLALLQLVSGVARGLDGELSGDPRDAHFRDRLEPCTLGRSCDSPASTA